MLAEETVFKMYIKDKCPYCDKARDIILKELKCTLHTINITNDPDIRELTIKETGQKTVPVIYLGDKFIGGCDDLVELCKSSDFQTKILREEINILRNEVIKLKRSL
jgi:glutaredoxin 3